MAVKNNVKNYGLLALEMTLIFSLLSLFGYSVIAEVGENATVITQLDVGNVYPEILNVSIDDGAASVTLVANDTQTVSCVAVVRDYNGEGDINGTGNITATFYDANGFTHSSPDDNNSHYTNSSCYINNSFGSYNGFNDDAYSVLANCTFAVQYYANADSWNCNVTVNDTYGWDDSGYNNITISELLALGLPAVINYGTVNATEVSPENITNVTNYGNVKVNLSLSGYAVTEEDGWAMNCSQGNVQNISIEYEKYNLTASNTSTLTLAQFENLYVNLTDTPVVNDFQLDYNQNDAVNDAIKPSYWRIYVPIGVAGSCTGNIVFGATTAAP